MLDTWEVNFTGTENTRYSGKLTHSLPNFQESLSDEKAKIEFQPINMLCQSYTHFELASPLLFEIYMYNTYACI